MAGSELRAPSCAGTCTAGSDMYCKSSQIGRAVILVHLCLPGTGNNILHGGAVLRGCTPWKKGCMGSLYAYNAMHGLELVCDNLISHSQEDLAG